MKKLKILACLLFLGLASFTLVSCGEEEEPAASNHGDIQVEE